MDFANRLFVCIITGIIILVIDIILLIEPGIDVAYFSAIMVFAIAIITVPTFGFKGPTVTVGDTLRIKGPFVDTEIIYSTIREMEFRQEFKPGIRTYGLGLIRSGSGDFRNKELGYYTFSGNGKIPAFIIIKYLTGRVVVFNTKDAGETFSLYTQIKSRCSDVPDKVTVDSGEIKESRRVKGARLTAVIAITLVAVAAIVIVAFGAGHVNASLDDSTLHVDAVMVNENIAYTDISLVELRDDVSYGSRAMGYGGMDYLSGTFKNDEFGRYTLAVHSNNAKCIVVHHSGGVLVFNLGDDAATASFYTDLLAKL